MGSVALPQHAKADTFCGYAFFGCEIYVTVNIDSSTYAPGATITTWGSITNSFCGNSGWVADQLFGSIPGITGEQALYNGAFLGGATVYFAGYFGAPTTPGGYSFHYRHYYPAGNTTATYDIPFSVVSPVIQLTPWVTYCTGAGNSNPAYDWTYWQWANFTDGTHYQYYSPGDASCAPTPPPSGAITSISPNPCNIARGQTACQPTVSWTTANTNGVVAINAVGWSQYPTESGYSGYIPTSGAAAMTPLAVGAYTLKLYGQNSSGAWNLLDQKAVSVPPPPPTSITASCPAPGTTATFSWPAVAGADEYQIQYTSTTHSCAPGWTLYTDGTTCYADIGTNSISIPTTPGMSSGAWVNAANSGIGWGDWNQQPSTGFTCGVSTPPSGTLTAPSCTIASGNSTCAVPIAWTALNSFSAGAPFSQLNVYAVGAGANCPWDKPFGGTFGLTGCSTPPYSAWTNGTSFFQAGAAGNTNISFPNGTYTAVSYGVDSSGTWQVLQSKNITAACVAGTTWDGSKCVASGLTCTPGSPCTSTPNSCGDTSGTCNASGTACVPPANSSCPVCTPGASCTSTPNSCGNTNGTISCPSNTCTPPANTSCPVCTPGASCTSAANSCGMTNNGSFNGTCSCSATKPSDSLCPSPSSPPTILNFTVNPIRVRPNGSTLITWECSANTTSGLVTGQNKFKDSAIAGTNVNSSSDGGSPLTDTTNFTLTCSNANGSVSATQSVFVMTIIEQ